VSELCLSDQPSRRHQKTASGGPIRRVSFIAQVAVFDMNMENSKVTAWAQAEGGVEIRR
jgi:hypothetical protein